MNNRGRTLVFGFAAALAAYSAAANPAGDDSRSRPLSGMASPAVEQRRSAAAELGLTGTMDDVPVLLKALRDEDSYTRELAEGAIWKIWGRSGDPEVDQLFQQGVEQMNFGPPRNAVDTFTRVIALKPDFAEAWNRRATIYFVMGEYEKSRKDCEQVLKRNPDHFGALAGYGQIYLQLNQPQRALDYFRKALAINPNMVAVRALVESAERALSEKTKT